ncbi:hypothetical protein GH733_007475 [Mirounga leonina]|nr:hypothetical protein GH733_007475 [Mirounga leonina]
MGEEPGTVTFSKSVRVEYLNKILSVREDILKLSTSNESKPGTWCEHALQMLSLRHIKKHVLINIVAFFNIFLSEEKTNSFPGMNKSCQMDKMDNFSKAGISSRTRVLESSRMGWYQKLQDEDLNVISLILCWKMIAGNQVRMREACPTSSVAHRPCQPTMLGLKGAQA